MGKELREININLIPDSFFENLESNGPWLVTLVLSLAFFRFLVGIAPSVSSYLVALVRKKVELTAIDKQHEFRLSERDRTKDQRFLDPQQVIEIRTSPRDESDRTEEEEEPDGQEG